MTFWHGFKLLFCRDPEGRKYAVPLMKLAYNRYRWKKEGDIMKFKTSKEWRKFHEGHGGNICNQGGGTMEYYCDKCGCND